MGAPTPTGTWSNTGGNTVNLSNPNNINLAGLPPGDYTFQYSVASNGVCPPDVSTVTLTLLPEILVFVSEVACTNDPNFYDVTIIHNGFSILPLAGTYTDIGNNMGTITNIPIDTDLVIVATNPNNFICTESISVAAPDCACPTIDPPINLSLIHI